MLGPYYKLPLDDQQRIDTRIFLDEIDRISGEPLPYRQNDARLIDTKDSLEERIENLRTLYAADIKSDTPYYNWTDRKFDEIKLNRAMRQQHNLLHSGPFMGEEVSVMEALVNRLNLPYPETKYVLGR